ncbi:MAG TPA: hypothetical protein DCF33_18520 [Saprospirales bacterium]|nr:hypothetical protein [Saprospirales bacterium]
MSAIPHFLNAVPHPGLFVGRTELLDRIHHTLTTQGRAVLVQGIGGIGKTTTALAYAHASATQASYQHVACFFVNSSLASTVLNDDRLLLSLGIAAQVQQARSTGDEAAGFAHVLHALHNLPGRILLIFDNLEDADNLPTFFANFDPRKCALLLTSRHEIEQTVRIFIEELPEADAADLFCRLYYESAPPPGAIEDPNLIAVIHDLDLHTLLLHMVALAGREAGYTLLELASFVHEQYIRHQNLQIAVGTGRISNPDETKRARIHSFVVQIFEELGHLSNNDKTYLRYFALLPGIPQKIELLKTLFQIPKDAVVDLRGVLLRLRRRGLLLEKNGLVSAEGHAWSLHRMVREVVVERLRPNAENCAVVVKEVTDLLNIDEAKENPVDKFPFIPYGEAILLVLEAEARAEVSVLLNNTAIILSYMGLYQKGAEFFQKALAIDLAIHGEDHADVSRCRANLASVYVKLGEYPKAHELAVLALATDLKIFGEHDPRIAIHRGHLANIYRNMGNYEKVGELLELALASDLKNFGELHPTVARSRANLANFYNEIGEHEKALKLLELALASDLKNLGALHPSIARYQANMANIYSDLGQHEKARELLELALASDLKNFGEWHPTVATGRSFLAHIYRYLHEPEKSRDLLQLALASDLKNFGEEHPEVAAKRNNLANAYIDLREPEKARELLELALASELKNFGEGHPNVARCYHGLAYISKTIGDYLAAKTYFQKALDINLRVFGTQHPYVAIVQQSISLLEDEISQSKP